MRTKELISEQLVVSDLRENILVNPIRDLGYRAMVAEWYWYLTGSDSLHFLLPFNKKMANYSDDGVKLYGAYGPRLMPQLPYVLRTLRKDPDTRQAVASIWTPNPGPSKDIPCTCMLQWLIRDGRLHCINTMRSSDLWLGLPNDFFAFSQITSMLAGHLRIQTGSLTMQLGSSHLYETNFQAAVTVLKCEELVNKPTETLRSPLLRPWPRATHVRSSLEVETPELLEDFEESVWDTYHEILVDARTKVESLRLLRELDLETREGNQPWSDPR